MTLTSNWGAWETVSLYLARCQVDTPDDLVTATWKHVHQLRDRVGKVLDFGAGDARFSRAGRFSTYIGYEIDRSRCNGAVLPSNAVLINRCAFSDHIDDADICIGNPPFVRNQDLPAGWRQQASAILHQRTGVTLSGLANAWQYFFLLALISSKADGLCALVVPYEWVSRPSVASLRKYILEQRWDVSVYRLVDTTFNSVLTTSSITIVDKAKRNAKWSYYEQTASGKYTALSSASGSDSGVLDYLRRSDSGHLKAQAVRGLSPGTQKVLTLTEGERVRSGLRVDRDVVPCVTTLRHLSTEITELDGSTFRKHFRETGTKCWLIRTDKRPSPNLQSYLDAVPTAEYQTATCRSRSEWWEFSMPPTPSLLIATSFKGTFPKIVKNTVAARAVGGVAGVYNVTEPQVKYLTSIFKNCDIRDRVVAHSNGLRKIEINQLNALLSEHLLSRSGRQH